jgi:hypothetical protein
MSLIGNDWLLLRDEPGLRPPDLDDTDGIPEPVSALEDRRRIWKARRARVGAARRWARARAELEARGLPELTHALDGTGAFCRVRP